MAHWTDYLDAEGPDGAYLPWKKVEPRVGISRTTAWRLQRSGDFPRPYVVSPGRVAYRESEVEAWKASRSHRSAGATLRPASSSAAGAAENATAPPEPPRRSQSGRTARAVARTGRKRSGGDQMTFEF